jgi:hypothetical protein
MTANTAPQEGIVPATTTVLVPAVEELMALLSNLEEDLVIPLDLTAQDHDNGVEDAWQMPDDLAPGAARDALGRIWRALPAPLLALARGREDDAPDDQRRHLLAPDGRYEHAPYYPIEIEARDLAILRAFADRLTLAVGRYDTTADGDLHSVLEAIAEESERRHRPNGDFERPTAAEIVGDLARVLAVLEHNDADTRAVLAEVTAADPGQPVTLTPAGEEAYQRLATAYNAAITGGSGLDRWLY